MTTSTSTHAKSMPPLVTFILASAITLSANATPYNGNAAACPAVSGTVCSIDLSEFMKSKYTYTYQGSTYTFDGSSKDSSANQSSSSAFISTPKLMYYNKDKNQWIDMGAWPVNAGFLSHPTQTNVNVFSKSGAPADGLEFFRWGANPDNSIYVQSEPSGDTNAYLFKSFGTVLSTPTINWRYRGYFWFDKKFDVTTQSGAIWLGPRYSNLPSHYYNKFNTPNGEMIGQENWHLADRRQFKYVNYYPSLSASWINEYGGQLPTPLGACRTIGEEETFFAECSKFKHKFRV